MSICVQSVDLETHTLSQTHRRRHNTVVLVPTCKAETLRAPPIRPIKEFCIRGLFIKEYSLVVCIEVNWDDMSSVRELQTVLGDTVQSCFVRRAARPGGLFVSAGGAIAFHARNYFE